MVDDDIDFKQAMQGVRRLKKESATLPSHCKPASHRAIRRSIEDRTLQSASTVDEAALKIVSTDQGSRCNEPGASDLFFLRTGLQKKILRDLKRGTRYPVETVLDLHGLSRANAQCAINEAIIELNNSQSHCMLIIHGKGLRSSQGAVLKTFTEQYLKTLSGVKAYCSAKINDGGTGALYVLLRK